MDLVSAMIRGSKRHADPRVQAYASGNRIYLVELRRPAGGMPTFDRATQVFSNPEDPLLYTGPARIYPATGGGELDIGEERVPFSAATITIDLFEGSAPAVDDTVTVLEDEQSLSTHLAGRVFEVTGVDVGGHFSYGWTLQTLGAAESRHG